VTGLDWVRAAGTSPAAIAHHYDLSDEFFRLWLGDDMVYSCGLWEDGDDLDAAQTRKLDFFASRVGARAGRVLDVGCGWGALLDRAIGHHGARAGVGLTLSPAQHAFAIGRQVPGVDYRLESWVDHEPDHGYDAITCIEATEHFASDALDPAEKVAVYRTFFDRCASWLRPGGRVGLQLICLDNVGHGGSRAGRGPASELIRTRIFPESMPASLSELAVAWEPHFRLDVFLEHSRHYRRTFRAWMLRARAAAAEVESLIGPEAARTFFEYFAAGELFFRLREHALYRVVLTRRPAPKVWTSPIAIGPELPTPAAAASASAVRAHYDVSNDFYRLWLGPTMAYSSALWSSAGTLEDAQLGKLDFFARHVLPKPGSRVLDIGCGWGTNLRRLTRVHRAAEAIGLTLSVAQREYVTDLDVRLEGWQEHVPEGGYDAITSYGAFEHFAADGSTSAQRVASYRTFFERCFEWLPDRGRLGLETIAHDDAPDTSARFGRGPLGDFVLELFPESLCPHLSEVVLGFEPWFELEVLRSDGADFARTFRAWTLGLRAHQAEAATVVGEDTVARFRRYLASSETQFRLRILTNYRLVLRRRRSVRR
jgi:cyclopropane-fatty-acyl-phospholipid synthase